MLIDGLVGGLSLDDLIDLEVPSGKVAFRCLLGAIVCLLDLLVYA